MSDDVLQMQHERVTYLSKSPRLLDAINKVLGVSIASDESGDEDSESEQLSPAGAVESISRPETTKDALLVSQDLEWTRDLVLLKWHGSFDDPRGDAYEDDDEVEERKEARKSLTYWSGQRCFRLTCTLGIVQLKNAISPSEVRVHFNLRPGHTPTTRCLAYTYVSNSTSSPNEVAIRRDDEPHTFITNGSFVIAQMATNGRLTAYALYMLQFDLRGPGRHAGPYGWETATQPPPTSIQMDYYIVDQFSSDMRCEACMFEMDGSGLRSVDYGPMARAMSSRVGVLSLPLPHPRNHQRVSPARRMQHYAIDYQPSDEQKRFWRDLFGSSDMDEEAKWEEAWMSSGNLWCTRRPDQ